MRDGEAADRPFDPRTGPERAALAHEPPRGRDLVVDGPHAPSVIGRLFANAFGLPPHAAATADAAFEDRQASWAADGRVEVHRLGRGGDFRYKVDLDLFDAPIDVARFPVLARRHGLTIAWCVDEAAPDDWHYHVVFPDGTAQVCWLRWVTVDGASACMLSPPGRAS